MTVAELIVELSKLDGSSTIYVDDYEGSVFEVVETFVEDHSRYEGTDRDDFEDRP